MSDEAKALAGHYGRDATINKILPRCYWHGMKKDNLKFIQRCDVCHKNCPKFDKTNAVLHLVPVPSKVMHQIGVDICQLPEAGG